MRHGTHVGCCAYNYFAKTLLASSEGRDEKAGEYLLIPHGFCSHRCHEPIPGAEGLSSIGGSRNRRDCHGMRVSASPEPKPRLGTINNVRLYLSRSLHRVANRTYASGCRAFLGCSPSHHDLDDACAPPRRQRFQSAISRSSGDPHGTAST